MIPGYARLAALGLLAAMLTACAIDKSQEAMVAQGGYDRSMAAHAAALDAGDWAAAVAAAQAAETGLPRADSFVDDETNVAHLRLNAQAAEAWAQLASGNVSAARASYDRIFDNLLAVEAARESEFKDHVSSARIWEAFGRAMIYMSASIDAGQATRQSVVQGLGIAGGVLEAPKPGQIEAELLDGLPIDEDGVRLTVMPSVGPMANIGRLIRSSGTCTASLIGRRLAITNAHCVTNFGKAGNSVAAGNWSASSEPIEIRFEGVYLPDRVRVTRVHLANGSIWPVRSVSDYSQDWAILELDRHPVGRGWFGVAKLDGTQENPIFIAGHSSDLNDGRFLTVDWGCTSRVTGKSPILLHSCNTAPGASGSPILLTTGDRKHAYLIGLNAFKYPGTPRGGGPKAQAFSETLSRLLANMSP